jgi:hypothetical protein
MVIFNQDVYPASLQTTAQERSLFTGNSRLFNQYVYGNSLFSTGHLSGMENLSDQAQTRDKPRVSGSKLFGEIILGMAGNVAFGYGGALLGILSGRDLWTAIGMGMVGYSVGSTFGSALGVYLIGNMGNTKGSFGKALLGSVMGEGMAILVSLLAKNNTVTIVSFITLPPIGAALFYNSSLRYKSSPGSNALLNFNKGKIKIGIPYVHIQPLPSYAKNVKPTVMFKVNLMNIVF